LIKIYLPIIALLHHTMCVCFIKEKQLLTHKLTSINLISGHTSTSAGLRLLGQIESDFLGISIRLSLIPVRSLDAAMWNTTRLPRRFLISPISCSAPSPINQYNGNSGKF